MPHAIFHCFELFQNYQQSIKFAFIELAYVSGKNPLPVFIVFVTVTSTVIALLDEK